MRKRILVTIGTRPEAIKLAPIIIELKKKSEFETIVVLTSQQKELLYPFIKFFDIPVDYDFKVMTKNQSITRVTNNILQNFEKLFNKIEPDLVLVEGDTTTVFATALAAFYKKIPVGHVEAGLRSHNKYNPFPEEINRRMTGVIADLNFAPTKEAQKNLIHEGYDQSSIHVTGNSVIDALFHVLHKDKKWESDVLNKIGDKKIILLTAHRRESFGKDLLNICRAIKKIAERNKDFAVIYPVHPNPNVREMVFNILDGISNIYLIDPLDYFQFVYVMKRSYIIITDSGGIQEEAPSLNKPLLVIRNVTERPELIDAGGAKLVGTDSDTIIKETELLLNDQDIYNKMANVDNPYGDGKTAERVAKIISEFLITSDKQEV